MRAVVAARRESAVFDAACLGHCAAPGGETDARRMRDRLSPDGRARSASGCRSAARPRRPARALADLSRAARRRLLRLTPWRAVLLAGLSTAERRTLCRAPSPSSASSFIRPTPACRLRLPGQPACAPATVDYAGAGCRFRGLGERRTVHVSGCSKGCAHPGPAASPWSERDGPVTISCANGRAATRRSRRGLSRRRGGARVHELRLHPRRRRDLRALLRHHPRRGRPRPRFSPEEARVAVRMIHACGMVEVAARPRFAPDFAGAARAALLAGAPILCDAEMVAHGVTRARLPAGNEVICTLDAPEVAGARAAARQHALGRGARPVGRAPRRRAGRDRQCADRAVPSARAARRRRAEARRRSSACRSASSARPNRRRRWPPMRAACRS